MSSVDVIVPCYRYAHFLRECVESVLAQSGPAVRVLIIDDASPDNTFEVASELVKQDERVTILRHKINKGHIETYNEGIAWCSADYLLLLSADDYLLPGALERAANLMDTHQEVSFTFGGATDLSFRGTTTDPNVSSAIERAVGGADFAVLGAGAFYELLESANSLNIVRTPTAVVRTAVQKLVGGYRQDLPHSGDLEMWLRLAKQGAVGILAANQAVCRFHGNNMQCTYYHTYLPDLEQRKAAFDCILDGSDSVIKDMSNLHRRLVAPLARQAVQRALAVFNEGNLELVQHLREFAVAVHPGVRRTMPWLVLSCKERMGLRFWSAVAPAVRHFRKRLL
jgi:hypothetical protein